MNHLAAGVAVPVGSNAGCKVGHPDGDDMAIPIAKQGRVRWDATEGRDVSERLSIELVKRSDNAHTDILGTPIPTSKSLTKLCGHAWIWT